MEKQFTYAVLTPDGQFAGTSHSAQTYESACKAAERSAKLYPGTTYVVFKAIQVYRGEVKVETKEL